MESEIEQKTNQQTLSPYLLSKERVKKPGRLVYILTDDPTFGKGLARQIKYFGYDVQIVDELSRLKNPIAEHRTVAILVDIPTLDKSSLNGGQFENNEQWSQISAPLIFMSDHGDQELRLKTIHAGGVAFLKKPINLANLIDKLDELNTQYEADPHRILIVEDQETVANYYQMVLKMANMETQVAVDPRRVLQQIQEFHPDLILMDLYMPEIDGIKLAKLIRQIDDYISTPIIFLSSEEDFSKQIEALNLGADDFLTKPIKASHLVALVKSRLERLRVLRSYMVRDSLTGLLNHTSFRGQLIQNIIRAQRQNATLALAMLDIDHFKNVNDTYGHPIGDGVLKSLSRLLKQRLRRSDLLGRYGGEEFVALMFDVDENNALYLMDEIRQLFSDLRHYSPNKGIFTTTFSSGIATFPRFDNANALIDAADQALYAAKTAGRNQVLLASR